MVQVKKRDGRLEDFDRQKVYRSVVAAGLAEEKANNIANQIQLWVQQSESIVSTGEIRKRVIGLLEAENLEVAENYKTYKERSEVA